MMCVCVCVWFRFNTLLGIPEIALGRSASVLPAAQPMQELDSIIEAQILLQLVQRIFLGKHKTNRST